MLFTLFKGKYPHCKEESRVRDYMSLFFFFLMDQNTLYFNHTSTARPRKAMKSHTERSALAEEPPWAVGAH